MNRNEEQVRAAVANQAGEWFVANHSGTFERADCAAFIAWLKASPLHIEQYLGVAMISRDLRAAVKDSPLSLESVVEMARADLAAGVETLGRPLAEREPPARRMRSSGLWRYATAVIALLVVSVDKAQEMGIDWWRNDPMLSTTAQGLVEENRQLRERLDELEEGSGDSSEEGSSG